MAATIKDSKQDNTPHALNKFLTKHMSKGRMKLFNRDEVMDGKTSAKGAGFYRKNNRNGTPQKKHNTSDMMEY